MCAALLLEIWHNTSLSSRGKHPELTVAVPMPEYEDVWNLQEQLPKSEDIDGTPMCDFYLRCCDRVPYIVDLNNVQKEMLN